MKETVAFYEPESNILVWANSKSPATRMDFKWINGE